VSGAPPTRLMESSTLCSSRDLARRRGHLTIDKTPADADEEDTIMSDTTTAGRGQRGRSFPNRSTSGRDRRAAPPHRCDPLADQGTRHRSVAGCAIGGATEPRALLDGRVRLAPVRGATERAAAVQDRDRRAGHPLHPCRVGTQKRVAVDHDARLAGLGRSSCSRLSARSPTRTAQRRPR